MNSGLLNDVLKSCACFIKLSVPVLLPIQTFHSLYFFSSRPPLQEVDIVPTGNCRYSIQSRGMSDVSEGRQSDLNLNHCEASVPALTPLKWQNEATMCISLVQSALCASICEKERVGERVPQVRKLGPTLLQKAAVPSCRTCHFLYDMIRWDEAGGGWNSQHVSECVYVIQPTDLKSFSHHKEQRNRKRHK